MNDMNAWAILSLLAVIVGALFTSIVVVVKMAVDALRSIDTSRRKELQSMATSHRDERNEWKVDANMRQNKTDGVIIELTKVIRQQGNPR